LRGKKLYVVLALAVVAAVATGYFLYTNSSEGRALETSSAGGARECGQGPAVMVVYQKGQEDLAMIIEEMLKQQLFGHVPQKTKFCSASVDETGLQGLRVYPAILVRAENVSTVLARVLLNETVGDGWKPMRYDYTAAFDTQLAMQFHLPMPVYKYSAKLIVVEGSTPYTSVNRTMMEPGSRVLALMSAIFVANVTSVEYTKEPPAGVSPSSLPVAYAVSKDPLDEGVPGLRKIGDHTYEPVDLDMADVFLNLGAAKAVEKTGQPPAIQGHPAVGNGEIHIAIYEDLVCPYCVKFYNDTFPAIKEMIDEGKVTFHITDLVVHTNANVTSLHKLLLCYYNVTGNAEAYLEAIIRIYHQVGMLYREVEAGNITSMTEFYNKIGQILEEEKARLGIDYNCTAAKLVERATHEAMNAGLRGTPSFAVWVEGSNRVLYITGYRDAEFFKQLVESLQQG